MTQHALEPLPIVSQLSVDCGSPTKISRNGGEGQNRTGDTTIFSRMLYQLSYLAPGGIVRVGGPIGAEPT